MLRERMQVYETKKEDKRALFEHKYKTEKQYKEEFEWLSEVDSDTLQQSRINLSSAYTNFFNSLKGIRKGAKIGFPKFKKKSNHESYKIINRGTTIRFNNTLRKVRLAKLGWVTYRNDRSIPGIIKSAVISKTPSGKYFVSVLYEQELELQGIEINDSLKVIGLDMSLQNFFVDSDGNSPTYERLYRKNEKKLAHYQRKMSKKQKGSKNREKARIKLAKIHEQIANARKDFTHKLSTKIVKENDVIVVEQLSLKGMSQALRLGKSVMDLGYSEFVRQLTYKSLWENKLLIEADRWFASSKTCNFCGFVKKDLLLQERSWDCPNCGRSLNRDHNAGINLKNYGLKELGLKRPDFKSVEMKSSHSEEIRSEDLSMKQKACGSLDRR